MTGERAEDGSVIIANKGNIRLGTRYITNDGCDVSVGALIAAAEHTVTADGPVHTPEQNADLPFH